MKNNQKNSIDKKKVALFRTVFDKINDALPDGIARTRSTTPANLYEALAVSTALAIQKGVKIDATRFKPLLTDEKLKAFTGQDQIKGNL